MNRRALIVAARLMAVVLASTLGFAALQLRLREVEARASVSLLHVVGADRAYLVLPTSIQVFPGNRDNFRAVISPSCSSAASAVALASLSALAPRRRPARRLMALVAAVSTVVVGNVVRIAASIVVGFVAGRSALILFHDWVGSVFTFAYTLGGFVLMLFLLLPRRTAHVGIDGSAAA